MAAAAPPRRRSWAGCGRAAVVGVGPALAAAVRPRRRRRGAAGRSGARGSRRRGWAGATRQESGWGGAGGRAPRLRGSPPLCPGPYLGAQALAQQLLHTPRPHHGDRGGLAGPCGDRERGEGPGPGGRGSHQLQGNEPYLRDCVGCGAHQGRASGLGGLRCSRGRARAGSGWSPPPSSAPGSCWGGRGAPPGCGEPHGAPEGMAGTSGPPAAPALPSPGGAARAPAGSAAAQAAPRHHQHLPGLLRGSPGVQLLREHLHGERRGEVSVGVLGVGCAGALSPPGTARAWWLHRSPATCPSVPGAARAQPLPVLVPSSTCSSVGPCVAIGSPPPSCRASHGPWLVPVTIPACVPASKNPA